MKKIKATFTIYQESGKYPSKSYTRGARLWRWRLTSRNGNIIADGGEGYARASTALIAVRRLIGMTGVLADNQTLANLGIAIEVKR